MRRIAVTGLAILWCVRAAGQQCTDTALPKGLDAFLKAKGVDAKGVVLTYSHTHRCWNAFTSSKGVWTASKDLDFDINGTPTLLVTAGHAVVPVVVDTNAFVFLTERQAAKEADSAELANLAKLSGMLASFVSDYAATKGTKPTAAPPGAPGKPAAPSAEATKASEKLRAALATATKALHERGKSTAEALLVETRDIENGRQALREFAIKLEAGVPGNLMPDANELADVGRLERLQNAFDALSSDVANGAPCTSVLKDLQATLTGGKTEWSADIAKQKSGDLRSGSHAKECDGFRDGIAELAAWLEAQKSTLLAADVDPTLAALRTYSETAAAFEERRKSAADLLAKRADAMKSAAKLIRLGTRLKDGCSVVDKVTACPFLLVDGPYLQAKWDKSRTGSFKLFVDPDIKSELVLTRADDLTLQYGVDWEGSGFLGTGFGVTLTGLKDPSYAAVTDPTNKDQKLIGRKDEDSRSGQVALFATFRPIQLIDKKSRSWPVRLGVDLGFGLKKTSLFVGGSIELFKVLRVGYGESWQKITNLVPGQHEIPTDGSTDFSHATVVSSTDDIRTRSVFAGHSYVSIVIAIDSLPFFKPQS
jgi:hypothetical protein